MRCLDLPAEASQRGGPGRQGGDTADTVWVTSCLIASLRRASETRESDGGENSCSTSGSLRTRHGGEEESSRRTAVIDRRRRSRLPSHKTTTTHCTVVGARNVGCTAPPAFRPLSAVPAADVDFGQSPARLRNACQHRRSNRVFLPRPSVCQGDRSTARDAAYGCRCLFFRVVWLSRPPCAVTCPEARAPLSLFTPCFACEAGDVGCQSSYIHGQFYAFGRALVIGYSRAGKLRFFCLFIS